MRPDLAVFLDGANDMSLGIERERFGLDDLEHTEFLAMSDDQRDELAASAKSNKSYTRASVS